MKKINGVLFLLLSFIGVASADELSSGLSKGMGQVLGAVQALLGPFFGAILGGGGDVLFKKVLFLAIILVTVYVIIEKMPVFKDNKAVIWIITISVSLLATRFMTTELLTTMLIPYTVLGVALTSILPFMIFFAFVQGAASGSSVMRKIAWALFGVTFLVIWGVRYDGLPIASWIYFGTAMVAFGMMLLDGTIRRLMIKAKYEQLDMGRREDIAAKIRKQLDDLESNKKYHTEARYNQLKRQLEKQLRNTLKP